MGQRKLDSGTVDNLLLIFFAFSIFFPTLTVQLLSTGDCPIFCPLSTVQFFVHCPLSNDFELEGGSKSPIEICFFIFFSLFTSVVPNPFGQVSFFFASSRSLCSLILIDFCVWTRSYSAKFLSNNISKKLSLGD